MADPTEFSRFSNLLAIGSSFGWRWASSCRDEPHGLGGKEPCLLTSTPGALCRRIIKFGWNAVEALTPANNTMIESLRVIMVVLGVHLRRVSAVYDANESNYYGPLCSRRIPVPILKRSSSFCFGVTLIFWWVCSTCSRPGVRFAGRRQTWVVWVGGKPAARTSQILTFYRKRSALSASSKLLR